MLFTFAIICLMQDWVMPGRWLRALIISPAGMQPGQNYSNYYDFHHCIVFFQLECSLLEMIDTSLKLFFKAWNAMDITAVMRVQDQQRT